MTLTHLRWYSTPIANTGLTRCLVRLLTGETVETDLLETDNVSSVIERVMGEKVDPCTRLCHNSIPLTTFDLRIKQRYCRSTLLLTLQTFPIKGGMLAETRTLTDTEKA